MSGGHGGRGVVYNFILYVFCIRVFLRRFISAEIFSDRAYCKTSRPDSIAYSFMFHVFPPFSIGFFTNEIIRRRNIPADVTRSNESVRTVCG